MTAKKRPNPQPLPRGPVIGLSPAGLFTPPDPLLGSRVRTGEGCRARQDRSISAKALAGL